MLLAPARRFLSNQRGSVESSLVLIPLLTLFLITSQIVITVHGRNMEKMFAQNTASVNAITGQFAESDTYLHIYSPDPNQNLDLVVSHREKEVIQIVPGLSKIFGHSPKSDVSGIALVENQR